MGFKNLFKKSDEVPKDRKVPENSYLSIIRMNDNLDLQEKREEYVQGKMKKLESEAKMKLSKGDKRGALYAMKKRKLHSSELSKIENIKMTLETQIISLEGATQNITTMNAMTQGNSAMKSIRQMFGGVETVDNIMDDVRDEMDMHREIEDAFTRPIDIPYYSYDEDDLISELMALETEDAKANMSLWPTTPYNKEPTTAVQQQSNDAVQEQQTETKKSTSKKFALFA